MEDERAASVPVHTCMVCGHTWVQRWPKRAPTYCPNFDCRTTAWERGHKRPPRNAARRAAWEAARAREAGDDEPPVPAPKPRGASVHAVII